MTNRFRPMRNCQEKSSPSAPRPAGCTLGEAAARCGAALYPPEAADARAAGVAYDSRQVAPGDLFCALAGAKADGAAFIRDALARGAVAVLHGVLLVLAKRVHRQIENVDGRRGALARVNRPHEGVPVSRDEVIEVPEFLHVLDVLYFGHGIVNLRARVNGMVICHNSLL